MIRFRVYDSEGNGLTTKDLALMIGRTATVHVNQMILKSGETSLKNFVNVWKEGVNNKRKAVEIIDKNGKVYNMVDVGKAVGRSRSWVCKAKKAHKLVSFEDFVSYANKEKIQRKGRRGGSSVAPRVPKFDRGKYCFRANFNIECKHYRSCADSRVMGRHHARFRKDGSCFEAESYGLGYNKDFAEMEFTRQL